ncbi:MAG: acyltransferase [Methanobrevibacter sp.]|jgi:surface polysaccharide O-acyltransferase-like enzyme|nr:acyltransferase [Candidatus Methanoflexus mossambicus]
MSSENRIVYLDQLRVLGTLGVICCHVAWLWKGSLVGSFNYDMMFLFNIMGRFGVPVFLMLSGVLLLNKDYEIYSFLKKRLPRIIWPMIFWRGISLLVILFTRRQFPFFESALQGLTYIVGIYLGSHWYVWMLIGVYLAMPVINEFVKSKGMNGIKYYLILWFITSIICCICLYYKIDSLFVDLSFFAGPIGFAMLGYYLHNKEFNLTPPKLMSLGLISFITATLLKTYLFLSGLNILILKYYIFQTQTSLEIDILVLLQCIGIFIFIKYFNHEKLTGKLLKISQLLRNGLMKKLTLSISKSSYGIYLNHFISLGIIGLLTFLNLINHSAWKWIPFLTILVLIVSWGMILILSKIPHMNKLTGYY